MSFELGALGAGNLSLDLDIGWGIEIEIAIGIGIERRSENTGDYLEIRKAGMEWGEGRGTRF